MRTSYIVSSCLVAFAMPTTIIAAPTSSPLTPLPDITSPTKLHDFDIEKLGDISYETTFARHLARRTTNVTDTGIGYNWGCTNTTGPDPLDCPVAIGQWQTLSASGIPENITIAGGRCVSIENKSCMAFACAPKDDVYVSSLLVSSRLMNPAQTRCVVVGRGGVWANGDSSVNETTLKVGLLENIFAALPRTK